MAATQLDLDTLSKKFDLPKIDNNELELFLPPDKVELLVEEVETAEPAEETPQVPKEIPRRPSTLSTTSRLFIGPLYDTIDFFIQNLSNWGSENNVDFVKIQSTNYNQRQFTRIEG